MNLPPIHLQNTNLKIKVGGMALNVPYILFGTFYRSFTEHIHSKRSYELHYIPRGKGMLIANGRRYPIVPGSLYMTGPDVVHEQITNPSDPMSEYCICFELLDHEPARDQKLDSMTETFAQNSVLVRPRYAKFNVAVRTAFNRDDSQNHWISPICRHHSRTDCHKAH